ncbi:pentatricopeptide repeat-containing protein At1g80270, mitochondrial-like [Cornus florida]|uniref:pentatricopeptide repeat-containing protein At1g80270, mitochondrial-like n=1 Tax=Cornus florida TaxID=4283 RepID=UPI0028983584|nr:pentatricopeptide repeat-containing protein At1g80270, mitochondrial-like [Cornus florida]
MWSLRRAAQPLRSLMYEHGASRTFSAKSDIKTNIVVESASIRKPKRSSSGRYFPPKFYYLPDVGENFYMGSHNFCSQAHARISDENHTMEDGSEPEASAIVEHNVGEKDGEDVVSEAELSDNDLAEIYANDLDLSAAEMRANGKNSQKESASSGLLDAIVSAPGQSINIALQKRIEKGNSLGRPEISFAMRDLRKRKMYSRALQFMQWLEANKQVEFTEQDYVTSVDLVAKVSGIQKAEKYINNIPEHFRGEVIYRTLLANCVKPLNMEKAEELFNKMVELELPISVFTCNQMLLLYKRLDKMKIPYILRVMEKEDIKPSLITYAILIDAKGEANDFAGIEELIKIMKAEAIEPDIHIRTTLARHYIIGGLKDKAEAVLKDIGESCLHSHHKVLPLYASLGNADEVMRIWKVCESDPKIDECTAAIEAWGKLGRIEEAEAVFEKMIQKWKKLLYRPSSALLNVYANHKLVTKGTEFLERMGDGGCWIGPLTWDAIVRLYVEAGEVEKADYLLQKAVRNTRKNPMFNTYMVIMDQYAKRGDVHNAEKLLLRMRQSRYTGRLKPYEVLFQAYVNAKAPVYGFLERMKADNVFPNRAFGAKLRQADAFRQTAFQDVLD